MKDLIIYNKITGKEVDPEKLIKDWVKNGKAFKIKTLFKNTSSGFADLIIIPKKDLIRELRKVKKTECIECGSPDAFNGLCTDCRHDGFSDEGATFADIGDAEE